MKVQKTRLAFHHLLHNCLKTPHDRLVTCGWLVGLIYFPFWLYDILIGTFQGAASLLIVAVGALGVYFLWQQRYKLGKLTASSEDRWLGHVIIVVGVGLAPFCFFTEWSQRLIWMVILVGIAISSWGVQFFRLYSIPVLLIGMGLFPKPGRVADAIWATFAPRGILERFAAWGGGLGLQAIGHPAVVNGNHISLPGGTVAVAWACNGFSMAITLATMSLLMGLFFRQNLSRIILLISIGIVLALIGNIPRIMLMALANAYWGKQAFEFWHGPWGGQIFATILLTIYYYIAMAIIDRQQSAKPLKQRKSELR